MQHLDHILHQTLPVAGFASGLKKLDEMGHPIHMITSRPESCREAVLEWLGIHGITVGSGKDDIITAAWFTNAFQNKKEMPEKGDTASAEEREAELEKDLREVWKTKVGSGGTGRKKLKVSWKIIFTIPRPFSY